MKETLADANFPRDALGRTYHVALAPGQVANRIIIVGEPTRARRIAKHFDRVHFEYQSHRGFLTLTGSYEGVPISVIAIGMGFSMVDFFLRECRAVVEGDMVVVRLGSCGSLDVNLPIGTVVVAGASRAVTRNYDWFVNSELGILDEESAPYNVSLPLRGDSLLHNALSECLQGTVPSEKHSRDFPAGLLKVQDDVTNGSADSFYGSQGRIDSAFWDENSDWVNDLSQKHGIQTLEMETYVLNHLAMCANKRSQQDGNDRRIRTGAVQMM